MEQRKNGWKIVGKELYEKYRTICLSALREILVLKELDKN